MKISKELQDLSESVKNFKELKQYAKSLKVEKISYYTKGVSKKYGDGYTLEKLLEKMQEKLNEGAKLPSKKKASNKKKVVEKKKPAKKKKKDCRDEGCPEDKVCNPDTGNCVLKRGKKGKEILKKMEKKESPKKKKGSSEKKKKRKGSSEKKKKKKKKKKSSESESNTGDLLENKGIPKQYQPKKEEDKKLLLDAIETDVDCNIMNNPCDDNSACMVTSAKKGDGKCVKKGGNYKNILNFSELYPEYKDSIQGEVIGTKKALASLKKRLGDKLKKLNVDPKPPVPSPRTPKKPKAKTPTPKAKTPTPKKKAKKHSDGDVIKVNKGGDIEQILKEIKENDDDDIGDISETKKEILSCLGLISK